MPARRKRNDNHVQKQSFISDAVYSPSTSPTPFATGLDQPPALSAFNSPALVTHRLLDIGPEDAKETRGKVQEDLEFDACVPPQPSFVQTSTSLHRELESIPPSTTTGHTRAPVLAREPTALESFSRAIRNYVPNSISIPSASPTPPLVSRPISMGRMTNYSQGTAVSRMSGNRSDPSRQYSVVDLDDDLLGVSPQSPHSPSDGLTTYPGPGSEDDQIIWSGWDSLGSGSTLQRLLLLGYRRGFQVWDCTNLGTISEVVNVTSSKEWGAVTHAALLPNPHRELEVVKAPRPYLGVVSTSEGLSHLFIYSLRTHEIVKKLTLPGLVSFAATDRFIVVRTSAPALHIISSSNFVLLFTIPSTSLVSFSHPTATSYTSNNNDNKSNNTLVTTHLLDNLGDVVSTAKSLPVFALSGRLLAFASPHSSIDPSRGLDSHSAHTTGILRSPVTTSDVGQAALRVGGTVLSGVKALGGFALNVAKNKAFGDPTPSHSSIPQMTSVDGHSGSGISALFKPIQDIRRQRTASPTEATEATTTMQSVLTVFPSLPGSSDSTSRYITIMDLLPLLTSTGRTPEPEVATEVVIPRSQPISKLSFSNDGTRLAVSSKDGHIVRVYDIRPTSKVIRQVLAGPRSGLDSGYADDLRSLIHAGLHTGQVAPVHVYDLQRGRTNAVIENISWNDDTRWLAIGSRKRTVHVFPVNPYGGRPDDASHLEGRVKNATEFPLHPSEIKPLVRLYEFRNPPANLPLVPISFTFIKSTESTMPISLLPPATPYGNLLSSTPPVASLHSSPGLHTKPLSPTRLQRPKNFQDVLCFDPMSGLLSLRRIWVDRPVSDRTLQVANAIPTLGGTSISLPGTSLSLTSTSVSPPHQVEPATRRGSSGSTSGKIQEYSTGLVGRDSVFATWNLRRGSDWPSVNQVVKDIADIRCNIVGQPNNWLSEAELSTASRTRPLHTRSIYLHHQFSFYALGEDYHALVRSYRFDFPVSKLEVRKVVQISAYTTGERGSFGGALPMDIRQPSSFDEPLASAMSIQLGEFAAPSPKILPMLPNGVPNPRLRDSIPIRSVATGFTDGVSEGLGRLRREINRAKSPRLKPMQSLGSAVTSPSWAPIEFDEEDEDSLLSSEDPAREPGPAAEHGATSRSTSRDGVSILTPLSTQPGFFDPFDDNYGDHENLEDERGWSQEDRQAIEDAERFFDISAAGLMDEEQSASGLLPQLEKGAKSKKRKGRK
ncbi:hypothetical protein BDM02DRAFT_2601811 [Thelephora ganbajun]|uniref:Uncharacterized protein n=1 Tax=Thelephora ganbajun TaxID=370292 RepID=A0ACB6ZUK5_THEGA|nr:hypothetical protein BDM02DRAFT_2601811 [Thelephora ganbajun]